MASKIIKTTARQVSPVFSLNSSEARRRVLNLYRAWYRQIPVLVLKYDVPLTVKDFRKKLHERFTENRSITDIRVIDMLVVKGQMDLVEAVNIWKTKGHIMAYFDKTPKDTPSDFLSKFYNGQD
ncbi:hypothetical protein HELRODRAFT_73194 [Helobdella robusta]|uniref:NADH dehydrogenase [ubiquinone] 1 alpha subcomplex subunit 6 n=1 Tax=Helobdella robusta TaxID=6412 RepID=T1G1B6_HELRO|nr:hypothetical protein HELRODRAFT_73194 [Helobdella robusta]ESO10027.1 hypothetical protein HELRODRAFT_73194 [Helobdella robusta]